MDEPLPFEVLREPVYENTYITTPEGHGESQIIRRSKIKSILTSMIETRVVGQAYDPVRGAQTAKQMADDVKEQVKALGHDRYKLIVEVSLGEKRGQAMRIASRCLWNTKTDTFVSEMHEGEDIYCCIQVYALYYE